MFILGWPSTCCKRFKSTPCLTLLIAKECLNVCGWMFLSINAPFGSTLAHAAKTDPQGCLDLRKVFCSTFLTLVLGFIVYRAFLLLFLLLGLFFCFRTSSRSSAAGPNDDKANNVS